jgi:hypothetical protein
MKLFKLSFILTTIFWFVNTISLSAQQGQPAVIQRLDREAEIALRNGFPSNVETKYIISNDVSVNNINTTTTYTLKKIVIERIDGYPTDPFKTSKPSVNLIFISNTGEERTLNIVIPNRLLEHDDTFHKDGPSFFGNNIYLPISICRSITNFKMGILSIGNFKIGDVTVLTLISEQIKNPLPFIGKWKSVTGNQTTIMTYYDDDTYTVEVNSTPREVGTYSFTGTEIIAIPTHNYNTSTRKLVEVPRRIKVTTNYIRSADTLILEGRGTFTLIE